MKSSRSTIGTCSSQRADLPLKGAAPRAGASCPAGTRPQPRSTAARRTSRRRRIGRLDLASGTRSKGRRPFFCDPATERARAPAAGSTRTRSSSPPESRSTRPCRPTPLPDTDDGDARTHPLRSRATDVVARTRELRPRPCGLEHLGQHRLVLVHMLKNVEGSDYVELLVEG